MKQWMLIKHKESACRIEVNTLSMSIPSLNQIEDALVCSNVLNSAADYQYWLKIYARKLSDECDVNKVAELCDHLVSGKSSMGVIPKAEFFKEILPIIGTNRAFQRIIATCKDRLSASEEQ
jgi:hypothetical protein